MEPLASGQEKIAEENIMLNKIEKLIVDGNKEALGRLDRLEDGQRTLGAGQQRLEKKVDQLDKHLDATAAASYELLTDVRKEVGKVNDKLEVHLKVPHAV